MSEEPEEKQHIGGVFCNTPVQPGLFTSAGQTLTPREREALWRLFQEIGRCWENLHKKATDSANLKSSWLDFLLAKTDSEPSYTAEYSNAVLCVDELIEMYGESPAFHKLFLENEIPTDTPPMTRLAHAKKYVVNEFIRVNIVASGFRSFGDKGNHGLNYKGYLGGSRYNLDPKVRPYIPKSKPKTASKSTSKKKGATK